jgi:hypothetical protein
MMIPRQLPYRSTARYVGDLVLGDDASGDAASAAVDAIEDRDTWRVMCQRLLTLAHEQRVEIQQLRRRIRALHDERRQTSTRRAA